MNKKAMNFQTGDQIGEYNIIRELGEGTFGEVYLAGWRTRKGARQGALKLLKAPNFKDLLEEVATWGRVSQHENVLTFLGAKEHKGFYLILNEYVAGGTLEDWLKANGGQSPALETAVKRMRRAGLLASPAVCRYNHRARRFMTQITVQVPEQVALRMQAWGRWLPAVIELSALGCRTAAAIEVAEVVRFLSRNPTPQEVASYHASDAAQERLRRLLALNEAGLLSDEENLELDELERLEHEVIMLKAQALELLPQAA
jgi:hypothetical protein